MDSNSSLNEFLYICRGCLSKQNLQPFESPSFIDLFKRLTDIQLNNADNLPNNICSKCINKLEEISSFIELLKNSDKYLSNLLKENKFNEQLNAPDSYSSDDEDVKIEIENNVVASEPVKYEKSLHSRKAQPSQCSACGENFETKTKLVKHQLDKPECKVKHYKCDSCAKAFFTKSKLKNHIRTHSEEAPYECGICLKRFRHAPNLKRHENIIHKGLRPFKCEVCGKGFTTLLRITEHVRIHTGERPHVCTYCGVAFKKYSTRHAHELRHKIKNGELPKHKIHPKKYARGSPKNSEDLECNICKKSFSSKQTLFVHNQIHSGQKKFLCAVCGRAFLRKSHLETHVRIHTGERPFKCPECGKHFRQRGCYRNHLLIHKGQKAFKCEVCGRSFIQVGHLQTHLKTHTGEKPYKCSFCGKGFAQNGNLKSHVRLHTGERPFHCDVCSMGFYDTSGLKKHKKVHDVFVSKELLEPKMEKM